MKAISILITCCMLCCAACSSDGSSKSTSSADSIAASVPKYDTSLPKGKITPNKNYTVFLPSNYSIDKAFPCIFFFDAHARGSLPIELYEDLAETYGFILIGSNLSKNGMQWQATNDIVTATMADVRSRINIDPKRIYTSGFSGGSKVASSVALFNGGIAGVIGCAAGFSSAEQGLQNRFAYFGIVGNYDFNLTEMQLLDKTLEQNNFAHQLVTFDGKHDWPPSYIFHTALLWLQAFAMKNNSQSKNDTIIEALKTNYNNLLIVAKKANDPVQEQALLSGIIKTLEGLTDVAAYKKQLGQLTSDKHYTDAVTAEVQRQKMEQALQQEFAQQFAAQNEKWWHLKLTELNMNIHNAKTKNEADMYQRLINFLGLVGYMNSNHALGTNDLMHAGEYLKISEMADPENADCAYLYAIYYMKTGGALKATGSLNKAARLGFSDPDQLLSEPAFNPLHNDAAFKSIVDKVRGTQATQGFKF